MDGPDFIFIMQVVILLISASVTLISLNSYRKFKNERLLLLAVAFLFISISALLKVYTYLQSVQRLGQGPLSEANVTSYFLTLSLISVVLIVGFAILAYLYYTERKALSIRISRPQWIIGGIILLVQIGFFVFYFLFPLTNFMSSAGINSTEFGDLVLANLISSVTSTFYCVLLIFIIISLFSYYRAKRTENTLVVMIGFICLLVGNSFSIFGYLLSWAQYLANGQSLGLTDVIELAGYIAFLVALLRLKVMR